MITYAIFQGQLRKGETMKNSKTEIIDLSEIELSNIEIQEKISDILQRHRPTKVYSVTGGNEKTTSRVYREV